MSSTPKRCSSGQSSATRTPPGASSKPVSTLSRSKTCGFTGANSLKSKAERLQPLTTNGSPRLIDETLPEEINKLHPAMVNEICLHSRDLRTIPNLSQFSKLQVLDLSCNNLTSIDNLRALVNLRELKLYGNQIEQIENLEWYLSRALNSRSVYFYTSTLLADQIAFFSFTQLQILQLQYNVIEKIGHGLVYLIRLQTLRIDANKLSLIRPEEVSKLSQLKVLDTSDCPIESLDFVNALPALTELRANSCSIKVLPNQLRNLRCLTDLDLSNNALVQLAPLKNFSALRLLRLANNQIQDIQILSSLVHLSELDLAQNRIQSIPNSFNKLIELQCLNLSNNHIKSWKDLDVLGRIPSLFILNIAANPFLTEEDNYIEKLSKRFPSLEIIDDVNVESGALKIPLTPSYEQFMSIDGEMQEIDRRLEKSISDVREQFDMIINDLRKLDDWYTDDKAAAGRSTLERKSKHRLFQALSFSDKNYPNSHV